MGLMLCALERMAKQKEKAKMDTLTELQKLIPKLREPDLMVKMADLVTENFEDVRERLNEYALANRTWRRRP
jgi:hypothetical protein